MICLLLNGNGFFKYESLFLLYGSGRFKRPGPVA
jgi:hypothetical protein